MDSYLLHDANAGNNFKRGNERIRYLLDAAGISKITGRI